MVEGRIKSSSRRWEEQLWVGELALPEYCMFARQGVGDVWRAAVLPSGVRPVAAWMLEVALNTKEEWRALPPQPHTLQGTLVLRLVARHTQVPCYLAQPVCCRGSVLDTGAKRDANWSLKHIANPPLSPF